MTDEKVAANERPGDVEAGGGITYTTAISALEKAGYWKSALTMIARTMPEIRLKPTLKTYGAVMSACDAAAAWPFATDLLDEMLLPGLREWTTVVLGCIVTFLFSYFFYGWASLQALFELDGVYREVCSEEEPLCAERGSRMIFLYSVDNTVSILAGTIFGILVDRTGPVILCILGALLQSLALVMMAWVDGDPDSVVDWFLLAFVIGGIGGTALMVQSLKLAFIVAPNRFALVTQSWPR
eukprot:Skav221718  [mRNA]  locus=scaffold542:156287:166819:- [translate_table: standard]